MSLEKNPNPTKDQHFMIDHDMLKLIYEKANIQEGESILEIGGGAGALTDYLICGNNLVTVIEKDPYYAKFLREKYKNTPNVIVIEGDALDYDYSNYDRIVANLPYTITEPFLKKMSITGALDYNPTIPKGSNLKSITLVLSQNSTRKMVAPVQITEGKSRHFNQEFGLMSVICKAFCDVDIVTAIPSSSFFPEPAVTSFVVNLLPKKAKTPVERILRELLIDKKGTRASIKKIYQLMLLQGKIYKLSKHKKKIVDNSNINFTSANILNCNIYDLNNAQLSRLVQDLIRNDINMKLKNSVNGRENSGIRSVDDIACYFINNRFVYNPDEDIEDEYDDDCVSSRSKFEQKYDYMYDSLRYSVLLHRGLEFLEKDFFVLLKAYLHIECQYLFSYILLCFA